MRRLLALIPFLLSSSAWAGPPLTLERVQQLALDHQPALDALQANARASRESAVAEGQLPDPRLKLGVLNLPTDSFALNRDSMTTTMVGVEQMFPGGDKRALRQRRAEAEAEQLAAELASRRHVVRRDAALAYLTLLGTQRQLALLKSLQAETERQVDAARIAALAGKGAQADILAARQMLTLSRDRESELTLQLLKARAELARWIGSAAQDEPGDELPRLPPPAPLPVLQERLEQHPIHAVQTRSVATAQADLALAREATKPDKSVEIGYGVRSRQFGDMVSVQFSMELPLAPKDRQYRTVAAKEAQVERAEAERSDHLRMLGAELAAMYAEWKLTEERLERYDAELLPDASQRVDAALAAYRSGRGELAAVLEARRAELEAGLARIQLATQAARARLQLAYFEQVGEDHAQHR